MSDYPGAIDYPAHPTNFYLPENHGGVPNKPRGWVLHTPEEPSDNYESTPVYFSQAHPGAEASTHYYLDNDGDVYQMVPERCAAIANGVIGKPYPAWANPNTSLNWQSLNVEIEGYGHSIHLTMLRGGPQWQGLLKLIKHRAAAYGFPADRVHTIGHYQVASNRSDPGPLFPWDALIEDLQEDDDMWVRHNSLASWFTDRPMAVGGYEMQVRSDFHLPDSAKLVRFGVDLQAGHIRWFDGNGVSVAGASSPRYSVVELFINEKGTCYFQVEIDAQINIIECLGYS